MPLDPSPAIEEAKPSPLAHESVLRDEPRDEPKAEPASTPADAPASEPVRRETSRLESAASRPLGEQDAEPLAAVQPATAAMAAPVPRPEAPRVEPKVLLSNAGLVMVETDSSRAQTAPAAADAAAPVGRPRRDKPKPAPEELVQVETQK